jgi:hypothetical protein
LKTARVERNRFVPLAFLPRSEPVALHMLNGKGSFN